MQKNRTEKGCNKQEKKNYKASKQYMQVKSNKAKVHKVRFGVDRQADSD